MPEESTTPDVVELTRRQLEALNGRDSGAVERIFAPDAVWESMGMRTRFEGVAAIRGFLEDWIGAYEEFGIESEEILDLGNGVVFGVFVQQGRPVGSSGFVQMRLATVNVMVDGAITRTTNYTDIDEARAAAERLAEERG